MLYLIGQIGLILAVAALLFFALGYWYGRHKAVVQEQSPMFKEGSVTAAAVSVLEDKIKQKDRQISLVQEQMADLEAGFTRARSKEGQQGLENVPASQENTGKMEGNVTEDSPKSPPATASGDDLAQMRGIGKALQKQLNEIGVNSFEQIAQWGKGDIEDYSSKLALKDRIRRDDWVGQAKKLKA